jgi:hypothetical protein
MDVKRETKESRVTTVFVREKTEGIIMTPVCANTERLDSETKQILSNT